MKIAIQGHPTRGKEVLQILESLGGKNFANHSFKYNDLVYYLNSNNFISCALVLPCGYRKYTLEEFEKEFPFKVGDKVITLYGSVGIIRALIPDNNKLPYCVETEKGYIYGHQSELKSYKGMERNITLTLDKAKEWYKKGRELKEIALQAFSEKELTKVELPKTWEEFCDNYPVKKGECWLAGRDMICTNSYNVNREWKNWITSKKSAEAHLAMIRLEQLRNCWWGDWKPEWNNSEKFIIKWDEYNLTVLTARCIHAFLVFPTRKMAEGFLRCFRDLIEKAGDLI